MNHQYPLVSGMVLALVVTLHAAVPQPTLAGFTDVTTASQIDHVHYSAAPNPNDYQTYMAGGVAAGDFDNDGWVDLYFTRLDASNLLYRNLGDGTFEDVTNATFGANHLASSQSNGAAWGDIDNDGDLDMYVTSLFSNNYHLYINDGAGSFTEEAAVRGASVAGADSHFGQSVTFGDYDLDGYLDMYVGEWRTVFQNLGGAEQNSRLLRNLGAENPGHFVDVTQAAGVAMDELIPSRVGFDSGAFTARFSDLDNDGLPDLAIASDFETSRLFWNNGDGTFTDGTDAAGVGTDQYGMGSALGDIDGDGDLDWFVTSIYRESTTTHDGNRLYRNDGNRTFTDITDAAGVRDGGWGWGATFIDHDNDGDLDLVEANGQDFEPVFLEGQSAGFESNPVKFWENDGNGVFTETAASLGLTDVGSGKGVLKFDYDNDGDLDVVIANNQGAPVIYRNDDGNANDWLRIKTSGTESTADGIGAKITVLLDATVPAEIMFAEISAGSNYLSQNELVTHFGLGDFSGTIDRVTVEWPTTGIVQTLENVNPNQLLEIVEPRFADWNHDGAVNQDDYTIWQSSFGLNLDAAHTDGDGNNDGVVSGSDFLVWQRQVTSMGEVASILSAEPLPEPSSNALVLGSLVVLLARTRSNQVVCDSFLNFASR